MNIDRLYCDALILAPILDPEIESLKRALTIDGWTESFSLKTEYLPFLKIYEFTLNGVLKEGADRTVIIVQLSRQGIVNAGIETWRCLQYFQPACVISFGIAGGFEDTNIGDVVFPNVLFYYEPAKYKKQGSKSVVQSRMDPIHVTTSPWANIFQHIGNGSNFLVGPFASGEKLFADSDALDKKRIGSTNDKILGVEMEAAGVGIATNCSVDKPHFFAIKGISDLADHDKNSISKIQQSENRKLAADNAAKVLAKMLTHPQATFSRNSIFNHRRNNMLNTANKVLQDLKLYGMSAELGELYRVINDHRTQIPVYFRWDQYEEDLNWIDFKILCAMAELPKDIFVPVPLVTIRCNPDSTTWRWQETVEFILGVKAVTDCDVNLAVDQLAIIAEQRGLSRTMQNNIQTAINEAKGPATDTLNWILYMLGQQKHARMVIFSWSTTSYKWDHLIWACDALFTVIRWETLSLSGHRDKKSSPVADICIDRNMQAMDEWLQTNPSFDVMRDFVNSFRACVGKLDLGCLDDENKVHSAIQKLKIYWKLKYFDDKSQA